MLSAKSFITLAMMIFMYFKSTSFSSFPCALHSPVFSSNINVTGVQSSSPHSNVHSESPFHHRVNFASMVNSTILLRKTDREKTRTATMCCDRPSARKATASEMAGTPSTDRHTSPGDMGESAKMPSLATLSTRTRPLTVSNVMSNIMPSSSAVLPNPMFWCFFTTNLDPGGDGLSDAMTTTFPTRSFIMRMTLRGPRTR
mmetsp:Transcript_3307/g.8426  ORF Transcript_3307/g.8426 Transcript_3307/m.8426 type:complete len:200 (+) Transcript_3307:321-920(+)